MAEYIDKQAFNDAIREAVRKYPNTFYNGLEVARQIAHDMDAADVVPMRHGRWIDKPSKRGYGMSTYCSYCGQHSGIGGIESNRHRAYCPNCGAKMDGEA